ncbi:HEAT repeat domain-containing protein [Catellatospora vulcania]|uniref:HEAT repeat domain-containing protein n=1 Tax=Catellatospora vulcania TaxID=1460450 RepID=UPI0012D3E673|nr:HEAT repeat domain-containing protein [Catellatospora vulcania]
MQQESAFDGGGALAPQPARPEHDRAFEDRPAEGEHWGPYARRLQATRDPRALPALLEAHDTLRREPRFCCVGAVRAALYEIATARENAASEPVADLVDRWWNSADPWEEMVAVTARAGGQEETERPALLEKVRSARPTVVTAAIEGLCGMSDADEIEALRDVVSRPDPKLHWAHQAAARRLAEIGGPDAEAALAQRFIDPDGLWREDPA